MTISLYQIPYTIKIEWKINENKSLEHLGYSHVWNPPNNTNHIRNISNYAINIPLTISIPLVYIYH